MIERSGRIVNAHGERPLLFKPIEVHGAIKPHSARGFHTPCAVLASGLRPALRRRGLRPMRLVARNPIGEGLCGAPCRGREAP